MVVSCAGTGSGDGNTSTVEVVETTRTSAEIPSPTATTEGTLTSTSIALPDLADIEAAHGEAADYPSSPMPEQVDIPSDFSEGDLPGSADRVCVDVDPQNEEQSDWRSGEFVTGNFWTYLQEWPDDRDWGKLYWIPLHAAEAENITIRATLLNDAAGIPLEEPQHRTVKVAGVSFSDESASTRFFASQVKLPESGTWMLVATSGPDWGCFLLTLPEPPPVEPSPTPQPTPTATATVVPTSTPEPVAIDHLQLNDIDGSPLTFLSVDEHPYFEGYTLVHGTLSVRSATELTAVTLEIAEPGEEALIRVDLAPEAQASLLFQPPDEHGLMTIETDQLLFRIPSAEFLALDQSRHSQLALMVRVQTSDGHEASKTYERWVNRLVRYKAENRYFVGEELQGGNDWVTPRVRDLLFELEGVLIGDISNMNGGPFPPHISHQEGRDIDLWFPGYNALDGATATSLLNLLDQPGRISRVEVVFVAYQQIDEDLFWQAIRDVTLTDGRRAADIFLPEPDHTTHFHLRLIY